MQFSREVCRGDVSVHAIKAYNEAELLLHHS